MRTSPAQTVLAAAILIGSTSALLGSGCDDEGPASPVDANPDLDPTAERWSLSPTSIEFSTVAEGVTDVRLVALHNESEATHTVQEISLVDTDAAVRFATTFIQELGQGYRWLDLDGDGQSFEVRERLIELNAAESLDVVLQYRPEGGLSGCLDPAPAACGFLVVAGQEHTVSIPLFVPRP